MISTYHLKDMLSYTTHILYVADIVECSQSTCSGHGSCVEMVGGGTACVCDMYYTSVNCSIGKVRS